MTTNLQRAIELRKAGRLDEALRHFRAAVREDPLNPDVLRRAGRAALEARNDALAASFFETCLRVARDDVPSYAGLGAVRFRLGDYEGSRAAYERARALRPGSRKVLVPLGYTLFALGREEEAYRVHSEALSIPPQDPVDRLLCWQIRVVRGDWLGGWADREARFELHPAHQNHPAPRRWRGEAAPDRTVVVLPDGGFGDSILFARYLPLIAERVRRVVVASQAPLDRLVCGVPGVEVSASADLTSEPEPLVVGYFSLPAVFGSTPATLPNAVPYLRAPRTGPALPPRAPGTRLRAGLCWAASPEADHDRARSCPSPHLLAPLFRVEGVEWVSLQVGPRHEEGTGLPLVPCPPVSDFADTAHVISQLDLVVAVDSAVANLAGALGASVWLLMSMIPEYRWPVGSDHSPWYPTTRPFRRSDVQEWAGVAERVARALRETLASGSARADP